MKHKIFFITVFIFIFFLARAAYAGLSYAPDGFRDLKWGDSHKKLGADCILIDKELDYGTVYTKRNENLKIENVQLQAITYSFYNDRLLNVTLEVAGKSDYDKLKQYSIDLFGKGHEKRNNEMESHRWDNEQVFIILDFIPQISEGQLLITYVPILEEVVQEIESRRSKIRPTTPQEMEEILR